MSASLTGVTGVTALTAVMGQKRENGREIKQDLALMVDRAWCLCGAR